MRWPTLVRTDAGDDRFRLCHLRGPSGIIVSLAEQIGSVKD